MSFEAVEQLTKILYQMFEQFTDVDGPDARKANISLYSTFEKMPTPEKVVLLKEHLLPHADTLEVYVKRQFPKATQAEVDKAVKVASALCDFVKLWQ